MTPDQIEAIQEAIEAGREAVVYLLRADPEGDSSARLALALDDLEGICR
jgi:hypothetical protein